MFSRRNFGPHALDGLAEPIPRRFGAVPTADGSQVVIDVGYGVRYGKGFPIGRDATNEWSEEFEFADDGSFELSVVEGDEQRAFMVGSYLSGLDVCHVLGEHHAIKEMMRCKKNPDETMLTIDYIRVMPEARGRGYAARLLDAALYAFPTNWAYADAFSQLIYKNLRMFLPQPYIVVPDGDRNVGQPTIIDPTDRAVSYYLDPLPVEGSHPYKGGFTLANKKHAHLLWKR